MEFYAIIIAIVALIVAIQAQSATKELKRENQMIKQMLTNPQQAAELNKQTITPKPQHVAPIDKPRPQPVVHKEPKPAKNMESIFGKNVIGVVASILMFIGIFAFGTLVFTALTDAIKVVGMFALSGITAAVGLWLNKKNPTVFTNCVTGCGVGMLYISIFITHLHFGFINDIATFALIFVWAAAVSVLSKRFKITSLSYIALIGCIISSILAQSYVTSQNMFVEITIYHLLTFVLLIISNKENPTLFKIACFSSILMNIILSIVITISATSTTGNVAWLYLCFVLGLYNLAICVLAYKEKAKSFELDTTLTVIAYWLNTLFSGIIPVWNLVTKTWIPATGMEFAQSALFNGIMFLFIAGAYACYHFLLNDTHKKTIMFIASESALAFLAMFIPVQLNGGGELAFLLLIPVANLLLMKRCKDTLTQKELYISGMVFLILDAFQSLFRICDMPYIGVLYSIMLIALSLWYMYEKYGNVLYFPFFQSALINIHMMFILFTLFEKIDGGYVIAAIILVLLNTLLSVATQAIGTKNKVSSILVEIAESILAFVGFCIVSAAHNEFVVSSFILSFILIPFVLIRLKTVIMEKNAFMSVWYGIKFTFYTFTMANTFTFISEQQFIASVFLMLLATGCIAFGFWKQLKSLRVYGLVLIMSSVFKMVILDVWNHDSLVRVISLIAGALICFGISAGYSKIEAKQLELSE